MVTRHVEFQRLHNFRDLGGYAAVDGRTVRWGLLYRSDSLGKLDGQDWEKFLALGVRTVIDLRYHWEIAAKGRVPEFAGLDYHNFSIEHRSYDQAGLDSSLDPAVYLADRYAEVALDGVKELRQTLETIAGQPAPVVFHCASGKDRTGIVAALVLSLLGVSEDDIIADFALTGLATDRLVADFLAANPTRTQLWSGYGQAPAELMRRFLADLTARHGSVRGYAVNELGVDEALLAKLRATYLTR
jgi:protein-tyrosine phosphatase